MIATGVVVLLLPGYAPAATTIAPGSGTSFPYQRWVDRAQVPTPDLTITVDERPDLSSSQDCFANVFGCAGIDGISLKIPAPRVAFTFRHELGHVFAFWTNDALTDAFAALTIRETQGIYDDELFADMYAICARRTPHRRTWEGPIRRVSDAQAICRLIRRGPPGGT